MLRLALIGCGTHSGAAHAAPLARYARGHPGEIELVAACDLDSAKAMDFAKRYGFARAYSDMEQMIEVEKPDGCICVVPVERIAEVNGRLFEMRMPCTVEKPPGSTLDEARRLAAAARRTGATHMVSTNRRFTPLLIQAGEWAGAQGPLQYVRATMVRHARREPGFIWSTGFHSIDVLRFLAGDVEDFQMNMMRNPGLTGRWYDIALRFANGCRGRLDVLPTAGMTEECYELFGEGFRVRVAAPLERAMFRPGATLQCWRDGKLEHEAAVGPDEPLDVSGGAYGEVVEFVSALREGRCPRPTLDDVLPSVEMAFALGAQAGVL